MFLFGPLLIAVIWILFHAGSDLVRWYGPALIKVFFP